MLKGLAEHVGAIAEGCADAASDEEAHGLFDGEGQLDDFVARDNDDIASEGGGCGRDKDGEHLGIDRAGKRADSGTCNEADGPDAAGVGLYGNDAAGHERGAAAVGEDEVGDLLYSGIDGANERNAHGAELNEVPGGPANEIANEQADDIDQYDGQKDAEELDEPVWQAGADGMVGENAEIEPFEEPDDVLAKVVPKKLPELEEEEDGDEGGKESSHAADEKAPEVVGETDGFRRRGGGDVGDVIHGSLIHGREGKINGPGRWRDVWRAVWRGDG